MVPAAQASSRPHCAASISGPQGSASDILVVCIPGVPAYLNTVNLHFGENPSQAKEPQVTNSEPEDFLPLAPRQGVPVALPFRPERQRGGREVEGRPSPALPGRMEAPLSGTALLNVAELVSPRSMMQLPTWSQAARQAVQSAHPALDVSSGSIRGRKVCLTWRERAREMAVQEEQIGRLPSAGEQLTLQECKRLCDRARTVLQREPNVVPVRAPVTIVGNVTGQFFDLLNIFGLSGPLPETSYLFLGGYVDRGYDSCRTISLLLLMKARYPNRITLLRGSHESRTISQIYNFYDQCVRRYHPYGGEVWQHFTDCFDYLPLAANVEGAVFCVHGGLSPYLDTLDQIREVDRFREVPLEGLMHDLLWTDPYEGEGWHAVGRVIDFSFGRDITESFLQMSGCSLLARAHQLVMEGFSFCQDGRCLTVFSAPNYCGKYGNEGAVVHVDDHLQWTPTTFGAAGVWPAAVEIHQHHGMLGDIPVRFQ